MKTSIFEKQITEDYLSKVRLKDSFTDWLIESLAILGFKIVTSKVVKEERNTGSYTPRWGTKIYYKNKLMAEDNNMHNQEYVSVANAISRMPEDIPLDIRKEIDELLNIVSLYEFNTRESSKRGITPERLSEISKRFVNILKPYDSQDREYLKK